MPAAAARHDDDAEHLISAFRPEKYHVPTMKMLWPI